MRQADVVVDTEYAWVHRSGEAVRVRAVEVLGRGYIAVKIVSPVDHLFIFERPFDERPFGEHPRQGSVIHILCRSLLPWDEGRRLNEKLRAVRDERDERERELLEPDPSRAVPASYVDAAPWVSLRFEREDRERYLQAIADGNRWPTHGRVAADRVDHLPTVVLRDLAATVSTPVRTADMSVSGGYPEGAVARALARTAGLLRSRDLRVGVPAEVLTADRDIAFLHACRDTVAQDGGVLELPWAPRLPRWVDQRYVTSRSALSELGWLRVTFGLSSGEKWHANNCRQIACGDKTAETHPLWMLLLQTDARLCRTCGGPLLRASSRLLGFLVAADVWAARPAVVESWQLQAVMDLIAECHTDRAQRAEPDRTLEARVVDALYDGPGDEGWHAYWLLDNWHGEGTKFEPLAAADKDAAAELLRSRLSVLAQALPERRRPLAPAVGQPATAADAKVLQQWWSDLRDALGEDRPPRLGRLLLTLPNAVEYR